MSFPFSTPVQQIAQHIGENQGAGRGLSPHLWQYMNKATQSTDGSDGSIKFHDDFSRFIGLSAVASGDITVPGAAAAVSFNGYRCFIKTAANITNSAASTDGASILLKTVATDNMVTALGSNELVQISDTDGDNKLTIFEAVFTATDIADKAISIGLGSNEGLVAAGLQTTGEFINSGGSFIGFRTLDATYTKLDFVYKAAGAAAATVVITALQTLVAGDQYKVGFVYDPNGSASKRIRVFLDDVEQTDDDEYVTAANIAASTFPDAEFMGMYAGVKAGTGAVKQAELHEWALYQEG